MTAAAAHGADQVAAWLRGAGGPAVDPALALDLATRMDQVERRLTEAVSHADELADSVSRHLVEAGGKRIRPLLTLLGAHLGDPGRSEVVEAAVVVELTQVATLYHDDVMDSAPVRRGAPAAHTLWGNNVAILTGDLLFARASRVVAALGPEAVAIQAATFERLCLGQLHETAGPRVGEDPVAHYLQVLSDKTASLIATSGRFGAMFGGCGPEVVDVMVAYGEAVGIAFQVADDVLDVVGDGSRTGKTPGTDLREGVPTLPALLARQAAARGDADARDLVALLDADLSGDAALAEAVRALRAHPVTAAAGAEARRRADAAVAALAPLPPSPARDALATLAGTVADRTS